MKRKVILSTIVIFFLGLLFITPVRANSELVMGITQDKNVVSVGENIEIKLSINRITLDGSANLLNTILNFDKNVFVIENINDIKCLNGFSVTANINEGILQFQKSSDINEPTDICTIKFKVRENASVNTYIISTKDTELAERIKIADGDYKHQIVRATEASTAIQVCNISIRPESGYKINNNKIVGVSELTTAKQIKDNIYAKNGTVTVLDRNNVEVQDNTYVYTGMKLKTSTGEEYTIIVKGDVNGDGVIDLLDIVSIKMHIVQLSTLNEVELEAANINDDENKGDILDLARLVDYRIGLISNL